MRSLIFLVLLCGCASVKTSQTYFIDTSCDLCIVEGEINGKKAYFLMDTGAGISSFDINQSAYFDFKAVDSDMEVGGYTNNSQSRVKKTLGIWSVKIKDIDISGEVIYAHNMSSLVKHVQACFKKRISGIIGVPVIREHGLVIDLTNNKLYKN